MTFPKPIGKHTDLDKDCNCNGDLIPLAIVQCSYDFQCTVCGVKFFCAWSTLEAAPTRSRLAELLTPWRDLEKP